MEVIYNTDLSRPGNDVYIYESVSLIKQFELYAVIKVYRVVGWSEREEVSVLYTSLSLEVLLSKILNVMAELFN